ncbi:MAG: hypothetical protein QM811_06305 [Pirellulales bacterium]
MHKAEFRRGKATAEWSVPASAVGERRKIEHLGPLGSDVVALSLKKLPPHAYLRITFDLLTFGDWSGASDDEGHPLPTDEIAVIAFGVKDAPPLMASTFSMQFNAPQSYPDVDPRNPAPPGHGSQEHRRINSRSAIRSAGSRRSRTAWFFGEPISSRIARTTSFGNSPVGTSAKSSCAIGVLITCRWKLSPRTKLRRWARIRYARRSSRYANRTTPPRRTPVTS